MGKTPPCEQRWLNNHREQNLKNAKEYAKNHLEERRMSAVIYRRKHPEKKSAQNKTRYIPIGSECELCGSTEHLERHHPNYNEPLEIVTLCLKCHIKIHKKWKEGD